MTTDVSAGCRTTISNVMARSLSVSGQTVSPDRYFSAFSHGRKGSLQQKASPKESFLRRKVSPKESFRRRKQPVLLL